MVRTKNSLINNKKAQMVQIIMLAILGLATVAIMLVILTNTSDGAKKQNEYFKSCSGTGSLITKAGTCLDDVYCDKLSGWNNLGSLGACEKQDVCCVLVDEKEYYTPGSLFLKINGVYYRLFESGESIQKQYFDGDNAALYYVPRKDDKEVKLTSDLSSSTCGEPVTLENLYTERVPIYQGDTVEKLNTCFDFTKDKKITLTVTRENKDAETKTFPTPLYAK